MIRKYKIIRNDDLETFEDEVAKMIEDGWQPFGNATPLGFEEPSASGSTVLWIQAMVYKD